MCLSIFFFFVLHINKMKCVNIDILDMAVIQQMFDMTVQDYNRILHHAFILPSLEMSTINCELV